MDTTSSNQSKPVQSLSSRQGSEALLGPTRRDARSVLHHPYEALCKAHHQQHHYHYRRHRHYLRHERYIQNSTNVWPSLPSYSFASSSVSSLARTAEWLRWLIHSAAASSLDGVLNDNTRQLMLLDLPVDGSFTDCHSPELDRMPGIRHYNQGTEETTGRPITPATTTSRPAQNTASKNQNNANNNNASNNNGSNNPNSNNSNTRVQTSSGQSTTAPHQSSGSSHFPLTPSSWSSQPPTPPTPTQPNSFNRSTVNSTTIAAAAKNARNRGEDDEKSASTSSSSTGRPSRGTSSSSGSTVGAGTPTSALLFSTSQEFHQIWSQTTAFLYRTFSPTYRVGHLYLDSWTNGTQRRGFEKLKASVLRGDAFQLMQSTITQLQNFWNRTVAENKAHAGEVRRQAKAIEDKRKQIQEHTFKSSSSSTSTSKSSSQTGHKEGKQDTNNDSNSKT